MKKVEQIKKIVDEAFGTCAKTSLMIEYGKSLEFVITSTITKSVVAVFDVSSSVVYRIKYIDAAYMSEMHTIDNELQKVWVCIS